MSKKNKAGLEYKGHNKFACGWRDVSMPDLCGVTDRHVYETYLNKKDKQWEKKGNT